MRSILFIFLFFSLSLYAQQKNYSIIVHKPFDAALLDITQNYDRTISAIGFSNQNEHTTHQARTYSDPFEYLASVSGSYGTQMHLIQADNQANIILSKVAKLSRFNKAVALVKTPDDGYFVGGYTLDGELIIVRLDAKGEIVFNKMFGTKNYDRMSKLVLLSDGGVLAVGSSFTTRDNNDNMFETGLGVSDIFLTRFTKDGYKLWSKKFGTKYDDKGIDAAQAADGSIVVVSTTSYDNNTDATLMRITENGNKLWLKQYKSENLVTPKKLLRLRDNNFVVSLIEYNALQQEHIRLIKFDLYKNILLDKKIFTTYPSGLNDIKEFSDGTIMGVGYVKDAFNTDALAMLLDSNLAMLRQEHYGSENYDIFNAVVILNNSEAAVAGIHTDNNSQESNMWITKLQKDTSIVKVQYNSKSLYQKLCELFADEIKNKQITISSDLNIELLGPSLYFETGVYKLSQKQETFIHNFGKKLIPFLKQHDESVAQLQINGHTSSEWAKEEYTSRYLKNEKLSMQRAYSVFSSLFKAQDLQMQKWLSKIIVGSGFSSSKRKIYHEVEYKKLSRRVSFKIVTK
ncbi:OmpA family protein [Sulfurimonas sp. C5]|uniref:OmpA family protein n=1 Tax=Sulfurimonas sp. C5 TaxID=3036947 RepID=UPI002457519E|nr:OmpA family protein [Sulfurimonas sp. C5]MDH4945042.1 OmpA family protein [Sulfurimonas sp. C5]